MLMLITIPNPINILNKTYNKNIESEEITFNYFYITLKPLTYSNDYLITIKLLNLLIYF
jgi:hypothetical protein